MAAPALRPLSTGEVLDVSFGLYRGFFIPLLTVAIATRAIPTILSIYLQASGGYFAHWVLSLGFFFISTLLGAIGIAATTFIVSGAYLGNTVPAKVALVSALGFIGRLMILTLLTSVIVGVGFVLLIVPGFILFSGLALGNAVLVLEAPITPNDAMSRSWKLTTGFRWKVFLTFLATVLLLVVPTMVVGLVGIFGSFAGLWPQTAPMVLIGLLDLFVYPFIYIVIIVLYYDLRVRKEGFDLELLAAAIQPA